MQIKVLMLITDLYVGGAPLHLKQLAFGLDRTKFKLKIVCLDNESEISQELQSSGFQVDCLGAQKISDLHILPKLFKSIQSFQPDVIHSFLMHANVLGRLFGQMLNINKVFASLHSTDRRRLHALAENLTYRLSKKTICISPSVLDYVNYRCHVPHEKLELIIHGIDCDKFAIASPIDLNYLGCRKNKKTIITVGRLVPVKGIDTLIKSFKDVITQFPCQLLIVGDGPEKGPLEQLAKHLNLAEDVIFSGTQNNIPELLKSSDLFVLPSHREGLSLATMEAMASGLPIVASDTTGLCDLLKHDTTALLASPKHTDGFTQAILETFQHPDKAKLRSDNAWLHVRQNYSLKSMVEKYTQLYLK